MNDTHREAAEQHELAANADRTAAEHNKNGEHSTAAGIQNGPWSTRIALTNLQEKPTMNQGRS